MPKGKEAHHVHRHVRENRPELLPHELLRHSMDPLQHDQIIHPLLSIESWRKKSGEHVAKEGRGNRA